jgi:hypothetical protein
MNKKPLSGLGFYILFLHYFVNAPSGYVQKSSIQVAKPLFVVRFITLCSLTCGERGMVGLIIIKN